MLVNMYACQHLVHVYVTACAGHTSEHVLVLIFYPAEAACQIHPREIS